MMIEYNVEEEDVNKLTQQEKKERLCNNKLKCLDISIKIKKEFENVINTIKKLSKKKQQSGFVILGMIKFSLKIIYQKISNDNSLLNKLLECLKNAFNLIKINNQSNFDLLKVSLMNAIETKNWDEMQHYVFNFEYGPEDIVTLNKHNKQISLGESADFNTESSTKLDNKLELSMHKELASSTRNLNISPMNTTVSCEFTQGLKSMQGDDLKFSKINNKHKMSYMSLAVDITMSAVQIKRLFISEMNNLKVNVKGDESSETLIAEKRDLQLFRSLLECFHIGKKSTETNSVQFGIRYSGNRYERIIELKSISGRKEACENMMISFVKSIITKVKKMRILRKSEGMNIDGIIKEQVINDKVNNLKFYGPSSPYSYQHLNEEDSSVVDNSNKEASNFYEFYKILSQENYDLGKSVRDFVEEFRTKYKNIEVSKNLIPKPMEDIVKFIDDCVSTFHCYFNFGKSNTEKMLPYCRPAVEKFIFNKLYFLLYDIYNKKYEEENKKFLVNQNNIKVKLSIEQVMDFLEIKKKFRGEYLAGLTSMLPYKMTIDCINKVEFEQTPKDKFDTLMKASLELRNCILDITNGKSELNSMDDELPLFIYLTTQINVRNVVLEISMIEDYLQFCKSIDKESKVLTNLRVNLLFDLK